MQNRPQIQVTERYLLNVYAEKETLRLSPRGTNPGSPALAVSAPTDPSACGHRRAGLGCSDGPRQGGCFTKQLTHPERPPRIHKGLSLPYSPQKDGQRPRQPSGHSLEARSPLYPPEGQVGNGVEDRELP